MYNLEEVLLLRQRITKTNLILAFMEPVSVMGKKTTLAQ